MVITGENPQLGHRLSRRLSSFLPLLPMMEEKKKTTYLQLQRPGITNCASLDP